MVEATVSSNNNQPPNLLAAEHKGFIIECAPKNGFTFVIVAPEGFDGGFTSWGYDSLKAAKDAIDKALKRTKKEKRTAEITAIPVLLQDGTEAVWKGINARTGNHLIEGHANYSGELWPLHEGIKALLLERERLLQRARAIGAVLIKVRVDKSHTRLTDETYDAYLKQVIYFFEEAARKAEKADLTVKGDEGNFLL